MEHILREWLPSVVIGKVLIQRNEETAQPVFVFDKLPKCIGRCQVILLVSTRAQSYATAMYAKRRGVCLCVCVCPCLCL